MVIVNTIKLVFQRWKDFFHWESCRALLDDREKTEGLSHTCWKKFLLVSYRSGQDLNLIEQAQGGVSKDLFVCPSKASSCHMFYLFPGSFWTSGTNRIPWSWRAPRWRPLQCAARRWWSPHPCTGIRHPFTRSIHRECHGATCPPWAKGKSLILGSGRRISLSLSEKPGSFPSFSLTFIF